MYLAKNDVEVLKLNLFGGVEEKMAKIEKNYDSFVCWLSSYNMQIAYSREKRILKLYCTVRIYKMRIYSNFIEEQYKNKEQIKK